MQMRPKLRCNTGAVHLPECDDCSALESRVGQLEEDVASLDERVSDIEQSGVGVTYAISILGHTIVLTGSDGSRSTAALPVYDGSYTAVIVG